VQLGAPVVGGTGSPRTVFFRAARRDALVVDGRRNVLAAFLARRWSAVRSEALLSRVARTRGARLDVPAFGHAVSEHAMRPAQATTLARVEPGVAVGGHTTRLCLGTKSAAAGGVDPGVETALLQLGTVRRASLLASGGRTVLADTHLERRLGVGTTRGRVAAGLDAVVVKIVRGKQTAVDARRLAPVVPVVGRERGRA
jgi:hypothetical protein